MTTAPTVSVILPVYQAEHYVRQAVLSVLSQTHKDFELLVVDDGSPDRSMDRLRDLRDPRIIPLPQEHAGQAAARNAGIRAARGRYLAFLDADDVWLPDKLRRHALHLEADPSVGISFCRCALINEEGRLLGLSQKRGTLKLTGLQDLLCRCPIWTSSAAVVRREAVEQAGCFDTSLRNCVDSDLWLRIAALTPFRIEGIDEVLAHYRINRAGISAHTVLRAPESDDFFRVLDKLAALRPDLPVAWGRLARAYKWRSLAQKAILYHRGDRLAARFLYRALLTDWRILAQEPYVTTLNLLGAHLQWLLPRPLYRAAESLAQRVLQRTRLHDRL